MLWLVIVIINYAVILLTTESRKQITMLVLDQGSTVLKYKVKVLIPYFHFVLL